MRTLFYLLLFFLLSNCNKNDLNKISNTQGIEFYLIENSVQVKSCKDFDVSNLTVLTKPLITNNEVLSYDWAKHQISFKKGIFERLNETEITQNRPFFPMVLSINGEKIYGIFSYLNSLSQICYSTALLSTPLEKNGGQVFQIYFGSINGKDPRGDKRIYDYLKSTGRLME
jgi:hypothetical protein